MDPTALNMATMFSGVFVVFVNALLGPRRILLPGGRHILRSLRDVAVCSRLLAYAVADGDCRLSSGRSIHMTLTFVLTALPKRLIIFGSRHTRRR